MLRPADDRATRDCWRRMSHESFSTRPASPAWPTTGGTGTPRVVPITWFHWNGHEFVVCSPPKAPKLKALVSGSQVALTIDS